MLSLETHLYQMHLLTNRKTLTTNKSSDGLKKNILSSLLSFMNQYNPSWATIFGGRLTEEAFY